MVFFDDLETRSDDQKISSKTPHYSKTLLKSASDLAGYKETLSFNSISNFTSLEDLTSLPVLRKSELSKKQSKKIFLEVILVNRHLISPIYFSPLGQSMSLVM